MTRAKTVGDRVLANCGDSRNQEWIPGVIVEIHALESWRPYEVELSRPSDGKTRWYFPKSAIINDTPRNREQKLEEMKEPAIVWFNGYFGTLSKRCVVVGETPKRYRVCWLEAVETRGIKIGDVTLVPKHAVEFIEAADATE